MVGSSRIFERVVTHQSIGYTYRSRTFPKAYFNILRGPERATLHAKGGALKGGQTKILDFETPFGYFRKGVMATHRKETLRIFRFF